MSRKVKAQMVRGPGADPAPAAAARGADLFRACRFSRPV